MRQTIETQDQEREIIVKTALITGTSTGIGLSAAVVLAKAGFAVTATMRDPKKADALLERAKSEGVNLEVRALDVTDAASIAACVQAMLEKHGRLDVLVNNAGAGHLGTVEQVSMEDLQRVMDVNFYGVWRTTQAVLPAMREARSGRIISISSVGGIIGQPFNDAYCAAKFALEGMMESLAPVVAHFGISVSVIEPGPVRTAFVENVGGREQMVNPADNPYQIPLEAYLRVVNASFEQVGQTGDDIAGVILEAATADQPHFRYQTSSGMQTRAAAKLADTSGDAILGGMKKMLGL
jgi:NAD(P)-dependent dehydrogenase (short-subunit alcohol dehydrogenase family)